jgi:formamidopyrimidine-DNA glycosylase
LPELPDLQVIREYLEPRLVGRRLAAVRVRRPLVVRNLTGQEFAAALVDRSLESIIRRGKFLLFSFTGGRVVAINPMLVGRLRYGMPLSKDRARDVAVFDFDGGSELRYHDADDMGKIYVTDSLSGIPGFMEMGPDADDSSLTLAQFRQQLRRHTGEIKGVLTNSRCIAGIGNAYADEILWEAKIYPFRRRPDLNDAEVSQLYVAMHQVLSNAVDVLRARTGDDIDVKIRDFLMVHGKPGSRCPRCGTVIAEVKKMGAATNFCRSCQPGLLIEGGRGP